VWKGSTWEIQFVAEFPKGLCASKKSPAALRDGVLLPVSPCARCRSRKESFTCRTLVVSSESHQIRSGSIWI